MTAMPREESDAADGRWACAAVTAGETWPASAQAPARTSGTERGDCMASAMCVVGIALVC